MVLALNARELSVPQFISIESLSELKNDWIAHTSYPLIAKPTSSAGGDSVFLCRTFDELRKNCQTILEKKNIFGKDNKQVLIQEYIEGTEYAIDTVSLEGKHNTTNVFVYEKIKVEGSRFAYRSVRALDLNSAISKLLIKYTHQVLDCLGIRNGASHSEVIKNEANGQPTLIEVGARMNGGGMPSLVGSAMNYSQIELLIDAYLRPNKFLDKLKVPAKMYKSFMVHCAISTQTGVITERPTLDKIKEMPSHMISLWHKREGDKLVPTVDLATCPMKVILANQCPHQLEQDHLELVELEQRNELYHIA